MYGAIKRPQTFGRFLLALILGISFSTEFTQASQTQPQDEFAFVAPEECWIYTRWSVPLAFDTNSENAAERLMAEPEVKAFVDDIITRIGLVAPALDAGEDKAHTELLHKVGPQLASIVFKRNGCFFVESIDIGEDGQPKDAKVALILDAGENAASLARDVAKVLNADVENGNAEPTYKTSLDSNLPAVITTSGNRLFIASSQSVIAAAKDRMAGSSVPKWLREFKSNRNVKHVSNMTYINVRKLRSRLIRLFDFEETAFVTAMGLNNAESFESCTGFTDKESFSRLLLTLDGRPEGILDLSSPKGLADADLSQLPADSIFASGLSFDMRRGLGWLNLIVNTMSGGRENLASGILEIERETGVHIEHDLIENLGKSWTLYNGAGDGWLSGMTLTTTVKDADALNGAVKMLIKTFMKETRRSRYPPVFSEKKVGQHTITTMTIRSFPMMVEPSWSISSERLIVGLFPQAIESALKFSEDQNATDSRLLSDSDLKFLRTSFANAGADSTLLGMSYVDTATNFELSYPYMQIMTSTARSMVQEFTRGMQDKAANQVAELVAGIQLPRARVIHRHLEPSLFAIRQTDTGIEFETRQTIPSLDIGFAAPIGIAALLPAVNATRNAARRVESQNAMRQHILAALNHESAHMRFPSAYTVDEDGQKLLSWRVQILPFIEQNNLYDQFKLDEPWDSPHNIKLLEKMPDVFRSPVSKAGKGMTTYRGVGGESGILQPGRKGRRGGIGFGSITDGTSNTIFLIETSDELAIEWTKPDGGIDPDSFVLAKLLGAYEEGINVAMCDGSVHSIDRKIDASLLKSLMTRAGGEVARRPTNNRLRRNRRQNRNTETAPVDQRFKIGQSRTLRFEDMMTESDLLKLAQEDLNRESRNKVRQVGLAMFNFESVSRGFPSAFSTDDDGKPLLSWRVHILPFLEENDLYQQFRLNEPWDSDHNKQLIEKMPDFYALTSGLEKGMTCLVGNGGPNGMIRKPARNGARSKKGIGFGNITDGSSNTIMLINAGNDFAVEWTKPESFEPSDEHLKTIIASEPILGIGDGSVIQIKSSAPVKEVKEMLTTSGGELTQNLRDHIKK